VLARSGGWTSAAAVDHRELCGLTRRWRPQDTVVRRGQGERGPARPGGYQRFAARFGVSPQCVTFMRLK